MRTMVVATFLPLIGGSTHRLRECSGLAPDLGDLRTYADAVCRIKPDTHCVKSALRASLSALVLVIAVFAAASTAATQTRIYKDPLGDAEIGHGDIASIAVSDSRGTVILRVDVRGLRDTGVLELKPRTLGRSEYALQFWRSGRWEFTYQNRQGTLTKMSRLPGLRFSRTGNIYSFRFGKTVLKGATRFFFEAHIDTATMADVSDWAPNGDYNTPSGWWKYTVASASR